MVAEVAAVCGFGYEDEGFDGVGHVGCADAESCADEVECFLAWLPFAGFDPVKVTGGCVGFDGERVECDPLRFADGPDGSSEYFLFAAHVKKVAGCGSSRK